jgi:hypothetical protein
VILDVDHHLHARKICRQCTSVGPALCRARPMFGRSSLFLLFLSRRLDLFGFLEPQQQLVLRQRLGPSAEAVTLQFLDDLVQPGILDITRQDHRLQRVRVVGKLVCARRHGPNQTTFADSPRQWNQG